MNNDNNSANTIIIDNGSGMVKAGFAGDDTPKCIFPSIIGIPKYKNTMGIETEQSHFIGNDAQKRRGILKLSYPIEHGIVNNWDDMEKIWEYTFKDQLRINSERLNVMLTEAPMNPKKNREKMMDIMFNKFSVLKSYIAIQGVLSLYSSGRTTGIILDIGDGVTHTIPIYEGYSIPNAINRVDIAGRDITDYLRRLLEEKGYKFITSSEKEIVRDIKEKICYNAINYNDELKLFASRNMTRKYKLPDGYIITINEEMFKAPEALFQPDFLGKETKGIHEVTYDSIIKSDMDIRRDLYNNIVLSGGTTMTKCLEKRLEYELNIMNPQKINANLVKIIAPKERKYSVWMGGSILCSLESFENTWITRDEYNEYGNKIIHKKCM